MKSKDQESFCVAAMVGSLSTAQLQKRTPMVLPWWSSTREQSFAVESPKGIFCGSFSLSFNGGIFRGVLCFRNHTQNDLEFSLKLKLFGTFVTDIFFSFYRQTNDKISFVNLYFWFSNNPYSLSSTCCELTWMCENSKFKFRDNFGIKKRAASSKCWIGGSMCRPILQNVLEVPNWRLKCQIRAWSAGLYFKSPSKCRPVL